MIAQREWPRGIGSRMKPEDVEKMRRLYESGGLINDVASACGVTVGALYKYKRLQGWRRVRSRVARRESKLDAMRRRFCRGGNMDTTALLQQLRLCGWTLV